MQEALTIGQLAARSGVAPSALRYYERLGLIRADRTGGNQRRYHRSELRRVAFIRIAQQVGVSLDEIRSALDSLPASRTPTAEDWAQLSTAWREGLTEKIRLIDPPPGRPGRLHRLRLPVAAPLLPLQPRRPTRRRRPRPPPHPPPLTPPPRRPRPPLPALIMKLSPFAQRPVATITS